MSSTEPIRSESIRQIVLDTETTGLEWKKGNRVV